MMLMLLWDLKGYEADTLIMIMLIVHFGFDPVASFKIAILSSSF